MAIDLSQIPIIYESEPIDKNSYLSYSFCHLSPSKLKFLHYHKVLEIGKCLRGSGTCYVNGKAHPFKEGDVQVFLPTQPHLDIADNDNTFWIFVSVEYSKIFSPHLTMDPAFLLKLVGNMPISGLFHENEYPSITALISEIVTLARNQNAIAKKHPYTEDLVAAKIITLLLEMSAFDHQVQPVFHDTKTDSILPALQLISHSVENQASLSVSEMAEVCFMSESRFRKLFSSIIGESPKNYLIRSRVRKAEQLLISTAEPMSDVMTKCGFDDASTFYRCFMKIHGVSPTEYRNIKS